MPERILSFEDAQNKVLQHARTVKPIREEQYVPLLEALGRTLALPVSADRDQPPFPRSTRDGYAIYSADGAGTFNIIGSVRAGEIWMGPDIQEGQAIEIMTGAPVPAGADCVLMLEHASRAGDTLTPHEGRKPKRNQNVVLQGAEAGVGQTVLPQGRRVGPAEISVAASVGYKHLPVEAKPTVAIIATGDELVDLDDPIEQWQIRNSNTYALSALVALESATPNPLPIARDTMNDLRDRIDCGRDADLLLLTGGVSMGKYDLVEQALAEHGAEFIFTGALIQPGKPIVFGKLPARTHPRFDTPQPERYFFGLPGNPVSTQVCFQLFVAPFIRALSGHTDIPPQFVEARLTEAVVAPSNVTRFLPAELTGGWQGASVRVVAWQGSGDVAANARGNAYAVLPANVESFAEGETIRVLLR